MSQSGKQTGYLGTYQVPDAAIVFGAGALALHIPAERPAESLGHLAPAGIPDAGEEDAGHAATR
jgi:hypothetical protein